MMMVVLAASAELQEPTAVVEDASRRGELRWRCRLGCQMMMRRSLSEAAPGGG